VHECEREREDVVKKILVATDFSPHADAALDLALELARAQGASITLFHTWQLPVNAYPDGVAVPPSPEMERDIVEAVKRGLARAKERVRRAASPSRRSMGSATRRTRSFVTPRSTALI